MPRLPKTAQLPLAGLVLLSASGMALSQNPPSPAPVVAAAPVISDDLINDFADLNRNLATLQEKVNKVRSLERMNQDASVPEGQRAAFRKAVSALIVSFADDGEVAQLGQSAVVFVHDKIAELQQDTHFSPEVRDSLIASWRRIATQTDAMVTSLQTTRKDLSDKLELLQAKVDFVDQMAELRQARKVVDAIGDVADQRQAVSDRIKDLLAGKASPPDM